MIKCKIKKCSKCGEYKTSDNFYKDKRAKSGLYSDCKKCRYTHYSKNDLEAIKKWKIKNPEKNRLHKQKYWRSQKGKDCLNKWRRDRHKTDPKYRLGSNMSKSILKSLKHNKGGSHWEDLVGYTLQELREHLEKQFDDKMNWDNYASYWTLDHIIPKSWYIYTKSKDIGFKLCWALENLQPLEAKENIRKNNKVI